MRFTQSLAGAASMRGSTAWQCDNNNSGNVAKGGALHAVPGRHSEATALFTRACTCAQFSPFGRRCERGVRQYGISNGSMTKQQ
eukprot:1157570-Pelagomonas_calceolata.AAC.4